MGSNPGQVPGRLTYQFKFQWNIKYHVINYKTILLISLTLDSELTTNLFFFPDERLDGILTIAHNYGTHNSKALLYCSQWLAQPMSAALMYPLTLD